jgi:NAD(P)H dehydrogenase (quinone)
MKASTLLVTGASGHLGRLVLRKLLAKKTGDIIATTRTPENLADLTQRGVNVRMASFDDDVATLASVFSGAERLLLISTDTIDAQSTRQRQHKNAIDAAKRAGVRHIVYTSLVDAKTSPLVLAPDHKATEEALEASGLGYTIVRNNFYSELLLDKVKTGKIVAASGDGKVAYVAREDCAAVAAAALASSFEGKRVIDVTGPEALSAADVARIVKLEYVPLSVDELAASLRKHGLPAPVADMVAQIDAGIAAGALAKVGNGVQDMTGERPVSVEAFLAKHR